MNKALLESLDEEALNLLRAYIESLVEEGIIGGSGATRVLRPSECLERLGLWMVVSLQYPANVISGIRDRLNTEDDERRLAARIARCDTSRKRDYRKAIFNRDGNKCLICSRTDDLTVDHIIPVSKGGTETLENLQTLCRECNSRKGVRCNAGIL